jgi:hypothetical protein
MVQIRERHNSVVNRLAKAIGNMALAVYGNIQLDCQFNGLDDECRLDIVIQEDNQVTIIDVTCPFDNDENALSAAYFNKLKPTRL